MLEAPVAGDHFIAPCYVAIPWDGAVHSCFGVISSCFMVPDLYCLAWNELIISYVFFYLNFLLSIYAALLSSALFVQMPVHVEGKAGVP